MFNEWGDIDRSHRKLAHRGSWLGRFWADPSTVRRVLERRDLRFRGPKRQRRSARRPWPAWVEEAPNRIWIYDTTHWTRAAAATTVISDVVSRKWIADVTSADETSIEVQAVFNRALRVEGLDAVIEQRNPQGTPWDGQFQWSLHGEGSIEFCWALVVEAAAALVVDDVCGVLGLGGGDEEEVGAPTDQAWIESLFGHLKIEQPHLELIEDIDVLRAELETQRERYNTIRLHADIGYVTPDQEHRGEGDTIRAARRDGLARARQRRIAYHRNHPSR